MTSYQNISATEFRVVRLLPGKFDDEIRCELEIKDCDVKTQYEALSYQWGAESLDKPTVRLAHLPRRDQEQPASVRYERVRTGLIVVSTLLLCRTLLAKFLESPEFLLGIIPMDWYMALRCFSYLYISVLVCEKVAGSIAKAIKTRPWLAYKLPYFSNFKGDLDTPKAQAWETVPVTPNLERALRYLRLEEYERVLWIDALCINQQDDAEKRAQIKIMDFLYANASEVRIWLGDYHGIGDSEPCQMYKASGSNSSPCQHQREISEAFGFIKYTLVMKKGASNPNFRGGRSLDQQMEDSMPGILAIARREYWQRLWAVQEAALGTGPINIQCGHEVCDLEGFFNAQDRAITRNNVSKEVSETFQCTQRFSITWKEFHYSRVQVHGLIGTIQQLVSKGAWAAMRYIFPRIAHEPVSFHDQPYSHRLFQVMLRESGYFHCCEERDRLYAVLGIVGGDENGDRLMANIAEQTRSTPIQITISLLIDRWVERGLGTGHVSVVLKSVLGTLLRRRSGYYSSKGRKRATDRPKYIMTNHANHDNLERAIDEIPVGTLQSNGGEFFQKIAQYLANETKSLSFLEAILFDDQPVNKASWVPRWQAKVDDEAYKFLTARRDGDRMAQDKFRFLDDGKTLEIVGLEYGCVGEDENVELEVTKDLLDRHGSVVLPYHSASGSGSGNDNDNGSNGTMDLVFIKAGEAKKADRVVFVPGCYHQLVLRAVPKAEGGSGSYWVLVGQATTKNIAIKGREKAGVSRVEWEVLRKHNVLKKFAIV